MRPDPGRDIQEAMISAMTLAERFSVMSRLRAKGSELAWRQSVEAGLATELERAYFLLDRLHPEMPRQHRTQFRTQLEAAWRAGRWHGFRRPG
jgi:hypothetical protein